MDVIFAILSFIFVAATFFVLVVGLTVMARGGKTAAKWSNKLMVARVCMQGTAILLIFLMFLSS